MSGKVSTSSIAPKQRKVWTFGLAKERDYLLENLGLLIGSGLSIVDTLDALSQEMRSGRMKRIMRQLREDIVAGSPLWKALETSGLFSSQTVSLVRLGEASGNLTENLRVVAIEQEKDRLFRTNIRSAMIYPVFVLSLTVVVGTGIAWFILPKLAGVFTQLHLKLPLITKILIALGTFLGHYGIFVVPLGLLVLGVAMFFIFSFHRTKHIGREILVRLPGIGRLLTEVELTRFGYLFGTLLEAGLPITEALDSLIKAADLPHYQKLYLAVRDSVAEGNTLQKSLSRFPHINHLMPSSVQFMLFAGERSAALPATLLKIGRNYEMKSAASTKDLTVLLEPILLIVVWLGVVSVALAVILPLYSLIGGLQT